MPRLIVNADDFGRASGVSRGIIEAHQHGIVTSTTMMVNLPWSDSAAQLARLAPTLGVGLHLTFSYGPSILPDVASLLGDDHRFQRDLSVLQASASAEDIEREAQAQLHRFVELTGRLPTHLDSHQHVHSWAQALDVITRLAVGHQLPVRAIDANHRDRLRSQGVSTVDAFINDFYVPGSMTLDGVVGVLRSIANEEITELMCHPGYDDSALADSSFRTQREDELRILCSDRVMEVLQQRGIELVDYRGIRYHLSLGRSGSPR